MHASWLGLANSIEQITKYTLDAIQMALGFDWAEFCLVENEQLRLVGIRGGSRGISAMPLNGPGVVVKVARTKTTINISDTRKDSSYVDHEGFDWKNAPTMLSELAVPVLIDGEPIAVLNTESAYLNAFTSEDQTLLEILAFHVGSAFRRLKDTEMIRKSEERYRMIFESANDPIFIHNSNGRIIEVNKIACDRYGYAHDELVKMTVQELTSIQSKQPFDKQIDGKENYGPEAFTATHRHHDGELIQVEISSQPIEFKGNRATLSIVRDISERLKYQQKLAALHQNALNLGLATNYDDVVKLTLDAMQFTLGFHHAGFEEIDHDLVRLKAGRGMSLTFQNLLSLDGPGVVVQAAKTRRPVRILDSRAEPMFVDSKVKSSRGETVRMLSELAVPVIADDSVVAVLNVESAKENAFSEQDQLLLDMLANHAASAITRLRKDEELRKYTESLEMLIRERTKKVSESEDRLRTIFESVNAGILIIDPRKHIIVDANTVAVKMTGATRDRLVGSTCHKFVCPADVGRCPITDLGMKVDNSERVLLKIDGKSTSILKSVTQIANGEEEYLLESFIDITERKSMEEELLKSRQLASVGETAAMVGHDLRNPLQAMTTALYLVKDFLRSETNDGRVKALELVDDLDSEVRYMDKIVSDLQDYARPVYNELIETDVHTLIDETIATARIPATIHVSKGIEGPLARKRLNPTLMKRVLGNLIINAIQAMPKGGELTIATSEAEGDLVIAVRDTGVGIPNENLGKLFTAFFSTKAQGQGLGLAVCKRLIEAQGGTITVQSQLGNGTIFTVRIPAQERKHPQAISRQIERPRNR